MHRLLVVLTLLAMLAAAAPAHAAEVITRERDDRRSILLDRSDVLRVSLSENPSTGSSWRVARRPAGILRRLSDRFVKPRATTPPTVGAPGRREIRWRAARRGTTRLRMELVPPGGGAAVGTFRLTVVVR